MATNSSARGSLSVHLGQLHFFVVMQVWVCHITFKASFNMQLNRMLNSKFIKNANPYLNINFLPGPFVDHWNGRRVVSID